MIEAHNINKLEGASLENAVKSDFGLDITHSEKIAKGYSSQVYKADLEGKPIFLRMNKDFRVFEVEKVGYKIFEEQGVPVPKIIAYQENPPSIKIPTIIMTAAEGKTIGESDISEEQKNTIYTEIGVLLRKINDIKLEGYGELRVDGTELAGQFTTWKEYCEFQNQYNSKALNFLVENNIVTNVEADKIRQIYTELSLLDFGKASLIHRDMHQGHVFIKDDKVSGIIDLGSLTASDPRYDNYLSTEDILQK